jgi:hypothetical protein
MTKATFEKVVRTWHILQQRIDDDADAVKNFGWVRDMYSWSFALAMTKTLSHMPLVPFNRMMVQIPADDTLGPAIIIHYTWYVVFTVICITFFFDSSPGAFEMQGSNHQRERHSRVAL